MSGFPDMLLRYIPHTKGIELTFNTIIEVKTKQQYKIQYRYSTPCAHCAASISKKVMEYSSKEFGRPLCYCCQDYLRNRKKPSEEAFRLYMALRKRLVPVEFEKYDGHKTIDMAVIDAKVNIEVDGKYHLQPNVAFSDLQRTYYSLKNDFLTLRIPNSLVHSKLEETADYITRILIDRKERLLSLN
jgi:very-short-patch-repair endonuclease